MKALTRTTLLTALALATAIGASARARAQTHTGTPPNAPFAAGANLTAEQALKEAPKKNPKLAPLQKEYDAAEARWKKKPKDAAAKKAYVEAAYKYGHTIMVGRGDLPPAIQYRASLALYRKALAVDPKHQPTLADKKSIEDIYKSMGRPIPK